MHRSDIPIELPSRATLHDWAPELLHRANSPAQYDVFLLRRKGREMILKDCSGCWALFRWAGGPFSARKEYDILQRLSAVAGVPKVYGWLDRHGFLMERLDADLMPKRQEGKVKVEFFDRLASLLAEIHHTGIAHGDLRRKNILMGRDGRPYLIDFATAVRRDGPLGRFLFLSARRIDHLKCLRLKEFYFPDSLSDEERGEIERPMLALRLGRFLKKRVYRHIRPKRWGKRSNGP